MPTLTRLMLFACAILLISPSTSVAGDDVTFLRLAGEPGKLQTLAATYGSKRTRVEVTLYGVTHIGEPAYYRRVQADLRGYDVVLFEKIERAQSEKQTAGSKLLDAFLGSQVDRLIGTLTGLTTQGAALDTEQANMRRADMTYEQLIEAAGGEAALARLLPTGLVAQKEALVTQLKMLRDRLAAGSKAQRAAARAGVRRQLARSTAAGKMTPEQARVLIGARNAVVLKHLQRELATRQSGRVCVLYGALHGPDLDRRLAVLGFARQSASWRTAWALDLPRR